MTILYPRVTKSLSIFVESTYQPTYLNNASRNFVYNQSIFRDTSKKIPQRKPLEQAQLIVLHLFLYPQMAHEFHFLRPGLSKLRLSKIMHATEIKSKR